MKKDRIEPIEPLSEAEFEALIADPRFAEAYRQRSAQDAAAQQESDLAKQTRELREAQTPEDVDRSLKWVMKAFKPMIRMKEQKKSVYFAEILSTERTRRQGLTSLADKWTHIVSMPADYMAVHYIEIILDDDLKTDMDKIEAMIEGDHAKKEVMGKYEMAWKLISNPKLELRTRFYK